MFTIQQQIKTEDGLYETVHTWKIKRFSPDIMERAEKYALETGTYVSFYLSKEIEIPAGYSWQELKFSNKIWKTKYDLIEDLPF